MSPLQFKSIYASLATDIEKGEKEFMTFNELKKMKKGEIIAWADDFVGTRYGVINKTHERLYSFVGISDRGWSGFQAVDKDNIKNFKALRKVGPEELAAVANIANYILALMAPKIKNVDRLILDYAENTKRVSSKKN